MAADGRPAAGALEAYAEKLAGQPVGGFAVWAHTGRGLYLDDAGRTLVLRTFRQVAGERPVIAGAGVPHGSAEDPADATVRMAVRAAELGADAVMVFPPAAYRDAPDRDGRVLRLHERVAAAVDLPLLAFHLHAGAGGYLYPPALVRDLLAIPSLAGVKLATLDRAVDCQDSIGAVRAAGGLAVTGEDRMFGPSLMWGAEAALVGIAAAAAMLSVAVLDAWAAGRAEEFLAASARLDRFAAATFLDPIEGYVRRMFWAAVWEGLIPEEAAHDPYGPDLPAAERRAVTDCLSALAGQGV